MVLHVVLFFAYRNLLSASQDGKLIVWDGYTTSKVSVKKWFVHISFLPFFRFLISASQDGKLIIWDSYKNNKVSCPCRAPIDWLWLQYISRWLKFGQSGYVCFSLTLFAMFTYL